MGARTATVTEKLLVAAAGLQQCVGEDRQTAERTPPVDPARYIQNQWCPPRWYERCHERREYHLSDQMALLKLLGLPRLVPPLLSS